MSFINPRNHPNIPRIPGHAIIVNVPPRLSSNDPPPSYPSSSTPLSSPRENEELRIYEENRRRRIMIRRDYRRGMAGDSSSICHQPPPTYSESELGHYRTRYALSTCLPVLWSRLPRIAVCPVCGSRRLTEVHYSINKNTHLAALALCLCGCWPFCLIPYFTSSCKIAQHYCARCKYLMAIYDPWLNERTWWWRI